MSTKIIKTKNVPKSPHPQRTIRLPKLAKIATSLLLLLLVTPVRAQSALDGFDPNVNNQIRAVVVQPDGKILIGGDFTSLSPNGGPAVTRNRIARLNPDGTLDTAFNPNASGTVRTIVLQPDGKILVAGQFGLIGGQMRHYMARLDPITGLPDSFDPTPFSTFQGYGTAVSAIAVQADGKILVGGSFTDIGGQTRHNIARLDPSTGLPDSFDPNANFSVNAIVVQPDGKILVGGGFGGPNSIGGKDRNSIARLDPVTGLADSFNPNAGNAGTGT